MYVDNIVGNAEQSLDSLESPGPLRKLTLTPCTHTYMYIHTHTEIPSSLNYLSDGLLNRLQ